MDGTILTMGTFTQPGTAVNQTIAIPSGTDFINIYNYTRMAAGTSADLGSAYWQRGMGTIGLYRTCAGVAAATAANAFTLYDPSVATPGAATALTNIDATTGIVTATIAANLAVGSIIRMYGLSAASAQQLGGIDFSVSATNGTTTFTLIPATGTVAIVPMAAIGACTGFYRVIQPGLFYPRRRVIANITSAVQAVVATTVNHGYSVGQTVRFVIPQVTATRYGITDLNGVSATIVAVGASNLFTIDVDTTAMTAFAFPAAASVPFSPAEVVPYGDNTGVALAQVPPLSSLEDSVQNTGFLGMTLAAGAALPAGVAADVIYWQAGKVTMGGL